MAASGLIDTGALLALLDRDDRWHAACVEAFRAARLPLLTSAAVLTELFHLVGDEWRAVDAAWRLVRSEAVTVAPIVEADLPALYALMARYRDRPMDFADATLVHLADLRQPLLDAGHRHQGGRTRYCQMCLFKPSNARSTPAPVI